MSALLRSLSFVTISKQFKLLNLTTFKASTILFKQNKSVHNFNDQIEYFEPRTSISATKINKIFFNCNIFLTHLNTFTFSILYDLNYIK